MDSPKQRLRPRIIGWPDYGDLVPALMPGVQGAEQPFLLEDRAERGVDERPEQCLGLGAVVVPP